ncbi:MAG: HD domain-containing protein, partial [Eubacteriales bacterium]|nr:HD domain-containing protein [Eubacteriales bacterium]
RVGKLISLDKPELDSLCLLAILHDIGKVIVPDNILNKPGSLNDAEWKQVRRHPEIGCRIISGISELEPVALGILTHHEHWNGRGYPQGLSGESIPLIARLVSIIDAYDAMTHDRPYHRAMTPQEALTELKRCAGSQFDPDLITKFIQAWHENPRDFSPV